MSGYQSVQAPLSSECLESGEVDGNAPEQQSALRWNKKPLLCAAGILALGAVAVSRTLAVSPTTIATKLQIQAEEVTNDVPDDIAILDVEPTTKAKASSGMQPCITGETTCPGEWLTAEKGGWFCRTSKGCAPWSVGEFAEADCPDQCSIGKVPAKPKPETKPAKEPEEGKEAAPADGEAKPADSKPAEIPEDGSVIKPCDDGEAECPPDWETDKTGGFYCRKTKGCSPWTKDGGAFDPTVCPDQCTIGNTPSTRTSTLTTTTITSTYPGMGIKLLCWSIAQPGYEIDILRRQKELYAGIFACDHPMLVTFDKQTIGDGDDKLESITCEKVEVGTSKDGTAANSLQFMKAWDAIKGDGTYKKVDWIVKVDPDAVLLPDRLRIHLNPHNGGNVYIRNCNKPMSEGTMMFGALEAISAAALNTYYSNFAACENEVPWQAWGEDLFMMRCLEHVGVGVVEDFGLIQDGVCNGVWCGDNNAAAFHPMKNVPQWEGCWRAAVEAR